MLLQAALRSTDGTSVTATLDYVEALLAYAWRWWRRRAARTSQRYQCLAAQNLSGGGWLPHVPAEASVRDGSDVLIKSAAIYGTCRARSRAHRSWWRGARATAGIPTRIPARSRLATRRFTDGLRGYHKAPAIIPTRGFRNERTGFCKLLRRVLTAAVGGCITATNDHTRGDRLPTLTLRLSPFMAPPFTRAAAIGFRRGNRARITASVTCQNKPALANCR